MALPVPAQARWVRVLTWGLPWFSVLAVVIMVAGGAMLVVKRSMTSSSAWSRTSTGISVSAMEHAAWIAAPDDSDVILSKFLRRAGMVAQFDAPADSAILVAAAEPEPPPGRPEREWALGWPFRIYTKAEYSGRFADTPALGTGVRWAGGVRTSKVRRANGSVFTTTFSPGAVVVIMAEVVSVLVAVRAQARFMARRGVRERAVQRLRWACACAIVAALIGTQFLERPQPSVGRPPLTATFRPLSLRLSQVRAFASDLTPDKAFSERVLVALRDPADPSSRPAGMLFVQSVPAYQSRGPQWTFEGFMIFTSVQIRSFSPNAEFSKAVSGNMPALRTRLTAQRFGEWISLKFSYGGTKPGEFVAAVPAGVLGAMVLVMVFSWMTGCAVRARLRRRRAARTEGSSCPSCGYELGPAAVSALPG